MPVAANDFLLAAFMLRKICSRRSGFCAKSAQETRSFGVREEFVTNLSALRL
jgi:hypothetical protein